MQPISGVNNLAVNRVVIQQGESRMLVYYWFQQRGRVITNEYAAKWYMFVDALTKQRTDCALVRLMTVVPPRERVGGMHGRVLYRYQLSSEIRQPRRMHNFNLQAV